MYRVRMQSGEDAVYRTPLELATAISSGVVRPTDHVFHTEANAWVVIQQHPDYPSIQGGHGSGAAKVTLSRPPAETEPEFTLDLGDPPVGDQQPKAPLPPPPAPPPQPTGKSGPGRRSQRARGRQKLVRPVFGLALPVVLAAAIGGGFLSEPLRLIGLGASDGAPNTLRLSRTARAERVRAAELTRGLAAAIAPAAALPQDPTATDSVNPDSTTYHSRQGARQPGHLNYAEAYADAQVTLEEAFDLVGFQALFSPSRFVSIDSIRAGRRMAAAGSNILRDYRSQEVRLEQSYNPGRSAASQTLRESYDRAESARALLAAADSLFGLLLAQDGRFVIRERRIRFSDPAAGRRYGELRQTVVSRARGATPVAREDEAVGALGRLRRVIGPDDPPFAVP